MRGPDADFSLSLLFGPISLKTGRGPSAIGSVKRQVCASSVLSDKTAPVTDDPSDVSLC